MGANLLYSFLASHHSAVVRDALFCKSLRYCSKLSAIKAGSLYGVLYQPFAAPPHPLFVVIYNFVH